MHGLINKSLQWFLSDSFGAGLWHEIARHSGVAHSLGADGFETMRLYDDALTEAVLAAAASLLRRPRDSLLEDFGTYLVSNERMEPLRRLLRFGGVSFTDFLYSLDDLRGRSRLALPELALPDLVIDEEGAGRFTLTCHGCAPGFGHVLVGILRALADDYGALAVLEHHGSAGATGEEQIRIEVHDPAFHAGRRFDLAVEQPG
ncbi:MAG: heme NO-binding domain-containing protein [Rhodobacter sp.]|uniref:heme NO-binding domain-containing protein n=1 Tax=Pararhodobacter sp. TaxID=2127056 RepID=UPI001DCF9B58|nr:heme NO-binding domain-containing protein [Pararhodobacter sp.]MCB1346168.1 heme NO-binding domain-containing protein [Paracoccaceae bacterium]MCC0073622.1 heme NO-binding domain-containing protein [Rhodobacter sp.]HPD91733.1 heme NO-binding domain-containing protein [Pararhodobacter sp.]